MSRPALSEDLVPVHELRSNLAGFIKRLEDTGRPLVITQRGRASAVLIRPEVLDALEAERDVVRAVLRGLREQRAGELLDDEDVWAEVDSLLAEEEGR